MDKADFRFTENQIKALAPGSCRPGRTITNATTRAEGVALPSPTAIWSPY